MVPPCYELCFTDLDNIAIPFGAYKAVFVFRIPAGTDSEDPAGFPFFYIEPFGIAGIPDYAQDCYLVFYRFGGGRGRRRDFAFRLAGGFRRSRFFRGPGQTEGAGQEPGIAGVLPLRRYFSGNAGAVFYPQGDIRKGGIRGWLDAYAGNADGGIVSDIREEAEKLNRIAAKYKFRGFAASRSAGPQAFALNGVAPQQ
jgi:hypothetical protein